MRCRTSSLLNSSGSIEKREKEKGGGEGEDLDITFNGEIINMMSS